MKRATPFALSLFAAGAMTAPASADSYTSRAQVLRSSPIIETVYEPVEQCHYETRRTQSRRGLDRDALLGGVIGGAAGSAVGKGSGRDAAAAGGALLGREIGEGDGRLTAGELIGGLAGGIIGNQVGKGGGKTAATAAGALLGATIGDRLENPQTTGGKTTQVRVCNTVEREKKIVTGYDVEYEHEGAILRGVLPYAPGDTVLINVGVDLIEERPLAAN